MAFYDPDGNKLNSINEFVEIYSDAYFIGQDKVKNFNYVQSSRFVEEGIIMPILQKHINTYSDFARIMAWKIGKIRHFESEESGKMQYAEDWKDCETVNPLRYGKEFDIKSYAKYIIENRDELERKALIDPQDCLRLLRYDKVSKTRCPNGIGTVYLITIMFFLAHGKQPIYDRMVMKAMKAYEQDKKPNVGEIIKLENIPGKWEKKYETFIEDFYNPIYVKKLDDLEYDYKGSRLLDRALWVYGHGFLER